MRRDESPSGPSQVGVRLSNVPIDGIRYIQVLWFGLVDFFDSRLSHLLDRRRQVSRMDSRHDCLNTFCLFGYSLWQFRNGSHEHILCVYEDLELF